MRFGTAINYNYPPSPETQLQLKVLGEVEGWGRGGEKLASAAAQKKTGDLKFDQLPDREDEAGRLGRLGFWETLEGEGCWTDGSLASDAFVGDDSACNAFLGGDHLGPASGGGSVGSHFGSSRDDDRDLLFSVFGVALPS